MGKNSWRGTQYRTVFTPPVYLKGTALAFYTECIDDADIAVLNGKIIGETGRFPLQNPDKSPHNNTNNFRSGVREARLYVFPDNILHMDKKNELILRVFDFAGWGGFCFHQEPVIGPYEILAQRKKKRQLANDIPRTLFMGFLLVCFLLFVIHFILMLPGVVVKDIFKTIIKNLNIANYFTPSKGRGHMINIDNEIASRYMLSAIACLMSFLFLLSEVNYKYFFIESELFWFTMPPIFFFIVLFCILTMLHSDTFGDYISRKGNSVYLYFRIILAAVTHPVVLLLFPVYLCFQTADRAWSIFIIFGIAYGFSAVTILFGATGINIFMSDYADIPGNLPKYLKYEGLARLLLLLGMIAAFILWYSELFFGCQFLFMNFFLVIYLLFSVYFLTRTRVKLPLKTKKTKPMFVVLQSKYCFTYQEATIACLIYEGYSRGEICKRVDIKNETIKKHLKSIYKKTIGNKPDSNNENANRDKFQRLTLFLNGINNNNP